jgi:hypothetical protein
MPWRLRHSHILSPLDGRDMAGKHFNFQSGRSGQANTWRRRERSSNITAMLKPL